MQSTSEPQPAPGVYPASAPAKSKKLWSIIGVVLLCCTASFLGSWLLVGTGLVRPDAMRTITENREKIVLAEGEIVADVFGKVSPSTVAIITETVNERSRFLGPQLSQGAGSGIVVSEDGYILTNKHVVPEGTNQVTVVMHDGKEYNDVEVVGRDPFNDLAFLKIKGASGLPPATIGDSNDIKTGQKVVAIGNALGVFRNSVTAGIISGIGRPIEAYTGAGSSEKLENLLQTDAAINPGNSGGPLVNLKGEVIGVNTAVSQEGDAIGFAIPINDAKGMVASVLKEGRIIKPYLGVRYTTLTPEVAKELGLNVSEGALVLGGNNGQPSVASGSPADKAGIKERDIIVAVGGTKLTAEKSLASALAQYTPGDKVELLVRRSSGEQKITVTLAEFK